MTWLEHATTSLISWGVDTRANTGSLAAVERTPLGIEVQFILLELQQQLGRFIDGRGPRWASSDSDSPGFALSLNPVQHNPVANGDPMASMSGLVGDLPDFVRPIRMMHASQTRDGPYRSLKLQVDDIYNRHVKGKAHAESLTNGTNPVVALGEQSSSRGVRSVGDVLPNPDQGPVALGFGRTDPQSLQEDVPMEYNASTENLQPPVIESVDGTQGYNLDLSPTEDLWGDVGTALRSRCRRNWHGAHFIAPKAFSHIMSAETVGRLLQGLHPVSLTNSVFEDSTVSRCSKVLAICLYARLAPAFFCYLMECLISDQQLPILPEDVDQKTPGDVDQKRVQRFYIAQWVFLPVQIRFDHTPTQYDDSAVLPIQCDLEKDLLGRGAFGDVYKVRISSDFQESNAVCVVNFAINAFSPKAISKQMKMLDHPNIVQPISFWVARQKSYILFPLSSTNLRQLLNEEIPPKALIEQRRQLGQMHKIVGALKFLHTHGSSKFGRNRFLQNQFTQNQKTSLDGAYMNIRPENIQIKRGDDDLDIWKLADFGIPNSGGISYSSPDLIHIAFRPTGGWPNFGELHDVYSLGCMLLEYAVWLHDAEDQTLRRRLSDLGNYWYIPMPNDPPELKHEVASVIGRLKQKDTNVIWLMRWPL